MADPKTTMESLIAENGGKLVRQRKHRVYRFPNGVTFVHGSTPSCPLADINALAALKRLLGIIPPDRGAPGTRRNKRLKQKEVSGSKMLPLQNANKESVETWQDKLLSAAIDIPVPIPKHQLNVHKPLTFEQRMLRAGVKKLDRND